MSFTILTTKETARPARPLLLVQLVALDGDTVYFSTATELGQTKLTYGGHDYQCRVLEQSVDAIVAMSAQGYEVPAQMGLRLGDGDLALWNDHALAHGWKGAAVTVKLVAWDAIAGAFSTDAMVFEFLAEGAEIGADGVLTVQCVARGQMTRQKLPSVAYQRRCPWVFPPDATARAAAKADPLSIYYQCGYSKGLSGGVGNYESGSTPYASCDYTREACTARGMFDADSSSNATRRFGGVTWVPAEKYGGRKYTSGEKVIGFNDIPVAGAYFPLVYGTQWVDAVVLAVAKEPNSVRAECVVCLAFDGPATVRTVVVSGHEVPQGGPDNLYTWRYVSAGGRQGAISQDKIYDGQGDPHGSMCCIEVVVPVELGLQGVRVLVQGPPTLKLYPVATVTASGGDLTVTLPAGVANVDIGNGTVIMSGVSGFSGANGIFTVTGAATYGPPGTFMLAGPATGSGTGGMVAYFRYNTNPVWHLLDLLTWSNWQLSQIDVPSFYNAAAVCDGLVAYVDANGDTAAHERFRSSFALENNSRQTVAQAVLGLRNNAGLMLRKNSTTGALALLVKGTLADQQPSSVAGSNYATAVSSVLRDGTLANGYLAYVFGAASIKRGTFRASQRGMNDSANRIAARFQDVANEWQTDSVTQIDPESYVASGEQEIDSQFQALGFDNFDQVTRRLNAELAETHRGNTRGDALGTVYVEFTASMKAAHLAAQVGAICGIEYEQLGF